MRSIIEQTTIQPIADCYDPLPECRISMNQRVRLRTFSLTLFLAVTPTIVLANAGSPMMWFGMLHILLLNLIIGIVESRIINYYGLNNRIWLIILANYISMFVGMYLIAPYFSSMYGNNDFWGGRTSLGQYELDGFMMGMLFSFVATLVIEFPFAFLAVRNRVERKNLLKPYILANLATNVAMFVLYFLIVIRSAK